jgi:hypothetical protein
MKAICASVNLDLFMVIPRPAARITHPLNWNFPAMIGPETGKQVTPDSEGAMRKGRFSEEQMVAIIREADRDPVSAVAKRHGISEQTIYAWRKRFGGLQATDVKRLRQLEARMRG